MIEIKVFIACFCICAWYLVVFILRGGSCRLLIGKSWQDPSYLPFFQDRLTNSHPHYIGLFYGIHYFKYMLVPPYMYFIQMLRWSTLIFSPLLHSCLIQTSVVLFLVHIYLCLFSPLLPL